MSSATTSLCFLTIGEAAALLSKREISPVELARAFLSRIEAVDGAAATFITVCGEEALAQARRAEAEIMRGGHRGPLHGIPYGLKDNFMTRGLRTTANSRLMLDHMPTEDAAAHRRLVDAGAVLLGKLGTYEYGTGDGDDLFELPFAPTRNPWDLNRFPGGSTTGGGASVALGTAMFALGTDTGGSVRLPAAACGAVGLKPTHGMVDRAGVLPNCYSLDCVGPIAWTARDAGIVLAAIADGGQLRPAFRMGAGLSCAGMRVGVLRRFHERDVAAEPQLASGFDRVVKVFRELGATLVDLDIAASLQDFRHCSRIINAGESYAIHEQDYLAGRALMGNALRSKLDAGREIAAVDYIRASRWRRLLAGQVNELFDTVDIVLCAGTTRLPPDYADRAGVKAFTGESAMSAFSISGHPALSLCSGFSDDGLPLNVQLAGRRFEDDRVLAAATAVEMALGLRDRRPPDPAGKPRLPPWAEAPPPAITDEERQARAGAGIRDVARQIPRDLPKALEPFAAVNLR